MKNLRMSKVLLFTMVLICSVFCGTEAVATEHATNWEGTEVRTIPVNYRTDGFSQYFHPEPPLTKEKLEQEMVEPLVQGGIAVIEWGLCAGTRLTYDSQVGQMFGEGVSDRQWDRARDGDLRVYRNLKSLKDEGVDPLTAAIEYAHKGGVKLFGRLEMNKGYGPIDAWIYPILNDEFAMTHPEYRMKGRLHQDFKYKAVRDRKLAILREFAERGCDGVMADFQSNDLWFDDPESGRPIMTQFIRDIRKMLDEVGEAQNRHIELMIRIPFQDSYEKGFDWKTCMEEGLIDYLSAFKGWPSGDFFDIRMDKFVDYRNEIHSPCKIYGHIWQALGLVDTDSSPTGKKRYSKPKTKGMYYAQALIHNRVGCDGIELGFASPQQFRPFYGELGTAEKIEFADKHYMVDVGPYMPMIFDPNQMDDGRIRKTVSLRVADDIGKAVKSGYDVKARIILTSRAFDEHEQLQLFINGNGPILINADSLAGQNQGAIFSTRQMRANAARKKETETTTSFINKPGWWEQGKKEISFPAEWLKLGDNELEFVYSTDSEKDKGVLEIVWVELTLDYSKKMCEGADLSPSAKERIETLGQLYNGSKVTAPDDIRRYKGRAAVSQIRGEWRKRAYLFNYEQLAANYGAGVEFQLRREQVILCPQTADFLYNDFTSLEPKYARGSRPELEKIVETVVKDCRTDLEKALGLMRYCRDLKEKDTIKWGEGFVFGGTEEYIIEKGSDICECLGRLYVVLCEIAGLPARIVMHDIAGHIVAEVYVDGGWGYVDPKTGLYFLKEDGTLASTWDVWINPSLMHAQSDAVKADLRGRHSWDERIKRCEERYFNINEVLGFENYSLADASRYNYTTLTWDEAVRSGLMRVNKLYAHAISRVFNAGGDDAWDCSSAAKETGDVRFTTSPLPESLEYFSKPGQEEITFSLSFAIRADFDFDHLDESSKLKAELVCSMRPLAEDERLDLFINGEGPVAVSNRASQKGCSSERAVEYRIEINSDLLWCGDNVIRFVYRRKSGNQASMIDLKLAKLELALTLNH